MIGKIFKAYDVRATYPSPLDEAAAWKVGFAAATYIREVRKPGEQPGVQLSGTLLVSRDMRTHSAALSAALCEGIRAAGMDVLDLGMCDTSFGYFAVNHLGAAGCIQTTASHNPAHYNGFKISGPHAKPIGAPTGLLEIQAIAEKLGDDRPAAVGSYGELDLWSAYRAHVLGFYRFGGRKLKVFVDGSNGMAGKMVPAVFGGVEGLELVPVNFEITGSFVHEPNPLVAENMLPTQEGTRSHGADAGACFDGDADRCIFCDETGAILGCDHLTALFARHFLEESPGAAVVYDLRSSKVVEEQVRGLGGVPVRSRVGHVFLKQALRESYGVMGGELSGHFYFRGNYFADSGAIAFAVLASMLSSGSARLSELVAPLRKYPQSGEINFSCEDKAGALSAVKARFAGSGSVDELDGVSVDCWESAGWWANIRASNTEPLLRLNLEAREQATLDRMLGEIMPMLGTRQHGH